MASEGRREGNYGRGEVGEDGKEMRRGFRSDCSRSVGGGPGMPKVKLYYHRGFAQQRAVGESAQVRGECPWAIGSWKHDMSRDRRRREGGVSWLWSNWSMTCHGGGAADCGECTGELCARDRWVTIATGGGNRATMMGCTWERCYRWSVLGQCGGGWHGGAGAGAIAVGEHEVRGTEVGRKEERVGWGLGFV